MHPAAPLVQGSPQAPFPPFYTESSRGSCRHCQTRLDLRHYVISHSQGRRIDSQWSTSHACRQQDLPGNKLQPPEAQDEFKEITGRNSLDGIISITLEKSILINLIRTARSSPLHRTPTSLLSPKKQTFIITPMDWTWMNDKCSSPTKGSSPIS